MLDFKKYKRYLLILGRPFLNTSRALIDVHEGKLTLKVGDKCVNFMMSKWMKMYEREGDRWVCMRSESSKEMSKKALFSDEGCKNKQETTFTKPKILISDNPIP